jgi:hypothetical protein
MVGEEKARRILGDDQAFQTKYLTIREGKVI